MPTTGPNFPTAATGNTNTIGGGTDSWTNPQNIESNDGIFSTCAMLVGDISDDLIGTGFGFSIPSTSTINGILLEINYKANNVNRISESNVNLLKAGVASGSNKSTGAIFPTTVTTVSYGSSVDLWGTTWSPSDINNANFGAAFVCNCFSTGGTASVDFFRITIFSTSGMSSSQMFFMF